jgi:hypothetical protein
VHGERADNRCERIECSILHEAGAVSALAHPRLILGASLAHQRKSVPITAKSVFKPEAVRRGWLALLQMSESKDHQQTWASSGVWDSTFALRIPGSGVANVKSAPLVWDQEKCAAVFRKAQSKN